MHRRRFDSFPSLLMVFFFCFLSLTFSLASLFPMEERFEQWIVEYGRVYKDAAEKARRFNIFKANVEYCDSINLNGDRTYRLGPTDFSDWTNEEYKSLFISMSREEFFNNEVESYDAGCDLPNEVDWRRQGAVTPVKNQRNFGSGWAFSVVATIEGIYKIVEDEIVSLSAQQLLDCDDPEIENLEGGSKIRAFEYIKNHGLTIEEDYPYRATKRVCNEEKAESCSYTINDYDVVPYDKKYNELNLKKAVSIQPVSVSLLVESLDFRHYKNGVFAGKCSDMNLTVLLSHDMTIVGYGSDKDEGDYWLVKNSWGTGWGEGGYIRMKRNIGNVYGLCGIVARAYYPIPNYNN